MDRRHFLKSSAVSAGVLTMGSFPHSLYAGNRKKYPHDRVALGSTGIVTSRMAMGTGTSGWNGSSNQTRQLGIKGLSNLLLSAYDSGITFFEGADMYGSHPHIGEALKSIPREKVTVLSKTVAASAEDMKKDLDRFRQEIGTDYIDIILLHCQISGDWNIRRKGVMEVLSQAREDGIISAHGVSCHSLDALETALADPWAQITLARFNPGESWMDGSVGQVGEILKKFEDRGKGLIGMKVFGAGELAGQEDECLQFTLAHSFIQSFTIGVESPAQLKDLQNRIPAASIRG